MRSNKNEQADKNYSVNEVAVIFGVHPNSVRRWIKDGKIKFFRVGGTVRITEEEIYRIIEGE